ncbi:MAG TPA: nitrile hydratase subunit beta [Candidatus Binatia bacterium]|jgi:nitrile hydratase
MNGIHDMGGMHGFGKVEVERDEPVFHERWEARVFAVVQSLGGGNIDAGRHSIERLDPVAYLRNGYFGRWLAALERGLIGAGVVTEPEIEQRMNAVVPAESHASPTSGWKPETPTYVRSIERRPKFEAGQAVVTRNHQPAGHTRLPGYGRCRRGVIAHVHPAMVYPDDHAHHRGENPQYLYTVRFDAAELWGDAAEANTVVHIDLFEPYLEERG